MAKIQIISQNPEELDDAIAELKKRRKEFTSKCLSNFSRDFLKKWDVIKHHGVFNEEFIDYIKKKENLNDNHSIITVKHKFKKTHEEVVVEEPKVIHYIKNIIEIKYGERFFDNYIESLTYESWQKYKEAMILVEKHLNNYVIEKQKKILCSMTDCYKEGIFIRYCETCGNKVEEDSVYCSECGEKFK